MLFPSVRALFAGLCVFSAQGCKTAGGDEDGSAGSTSATTGASTSTGGSTSTDTPTGAGDTSGEVPTGTDGGGDVPRAAAEQICAAMFKCDCEAPLYPDVEACVAKMLSEFENAESFIAEKGLTFNAECIDSLATAYSKIGCTYPVDYSFRCDLCSVMSGTRKSGEECTGYTFGSDCEKELECGIDSKCVARCGPLTPGEHCLQTSEGLCGEGLFCTTDLVCVERPGAGQSCAEVPCKEGFACGPGDLCATAVGDGESCQDICCAAGLYCDGDDVCRPRIAEGGSCMPDKPSSCASRCLDGLDCAPESGKCETYPTLGEECSIIYDCAAGFFCEDDKCVTASPPLCHGERPWL